MKKGFASIPIIISFLVVLVAMGFLGWKYLGQAQKTNIASQGTTQIHSSSESSTDSGTWSGFFGNQNGSCMGVKPPKQSVEGAFATTFADTNLIDRITNGSGTGDSRFTYLWIKPGQIVPIVAPADGVLVYIAYKTRVDIDSSLSSPDYDLAFLADCHTMYRINHITKPVEEIVAQRAMQEAQKLEVGKPLADSATKPKRNITVSAGQKLGETTGTPGAHNFDFGIFVDNSAVCPYEKFSNSIKANYLALFGGSKCNVSGNY